MDNYESPQSVGASKEGMGPMIEIQPKDTSRGHFYISLAKSFIRITAGVCLVLVDLEPSTSVSMIKTAGALLIAAEVLGILEELV